jgi:hypothetical protein
MPGDSDITTAGQVAELLQQVDSDSELMVCVDIGKHVHYTIDSAALVTEAGSETVSLAVGKLIERERAHQPLPPNPAEIQAQKHLERVAMNLLMYNTTIAARLAQGHGIDKETVAQVLEELAHAVRTGESAERMDALDDDHTLQELVN